MLSRPPYKEHSISLVGNLLPQTLLCHFKTGLWDALKHFQLLDSIFVSLQGIEHSVTPVKWCFFFQGCTEVILSTVPVWFLRDLLMCATVAKEAQWRVLRCQSSSILQSWVHFAWSAAHLLQAGHQLSPFSFHNILDDFSVEVTPLKNVIVFPYLFL